ncbi:MAG: DUF3105 domain-containing protein [Alphaproteobacteria bacterium]
MAKSRTRARKKKSRTPKTAAKSIPWGGTAPTHAGRKRWVFRGVLAAVAIGAGLAWWVFGTDERDFLGLAAQGQEGLKRIKTVPSAGGGHLDPRQSRVYSSRFPTSGRHHRSWTGAGFHRTPQMATQLVHALEHGNIVIYYDKPGAEVIETLEAWTGLYTHQWSGVIATPMPRLGPAVVLTAWTKQLRMAEFKAAEAAAFIDAFRGRGPEHPVR